MQANGGEKSQGSNHYIRQNGFQNLGHKNREDHFIIIKGSIHQEDLIIVNIYELNIGAAKYIKKILEDYKKDKGSNTLIVGDFNTPLSTKDRCSKQRVHKHPRLVWLSGLSAALQTKGLLV